MVAAREGTFAAAARTLYVTHSAVSQQMSMLEHELGLKLIERTPRGIELTPRGEVLAQRCTALFAMLSSIEADLKSKRTCARLGGFPSVNADLVPRVLSEFTDRHPNTSLEFVSTHAR